MDVDGCGSGDMIWERRDKVSLGFRLQLRAHSRKARVAKREGATKLCSGEEATVE